MTPHRSGRSGSAKGLVDPCHLAVLSWGKSWPSTLFDPSKTRLPGTEFGRDVVRVPGAFAAGEFVSRSDVETLKQLRCVITAQSEIQHLSPACASAIYVKVPRGLVTTLMEYQE